MSEAEEKNDKRPGKEKDRPTASFSGSAPVVAHRTGGSIRPFDFLNMNDYCTGVSAKGDNKE
ncbi:MAG: hypothetical protein ACYTBX_16805 [Planctomycetota bacterium]|jgi:hypothetical protein